MVIRGEGGVMRDTTSTDPQPEIRLNEETLKAIEETEKGIGLTTYNDVESFFVALYEDD